MKNWAIPLFCYLLIAFCTGLAAADSYQEVRIAIVGDSTVSNYSLSNIHRGWGQIFPEFVNSQLAVVSNFARGGRSTKTFWNEGSWDKTLAFHPDYIFIQFGHNDSHDKSKPEATDPNTDYSQYLRAYVASARTHGAIPILVTPMHRDIWRDGHLSQELLPYVSAMRQVAATDQVALIDLYAITNTVFEQMGPQEVDTLFALPATDKAHFNEKGARLIAQLVASEAARVVPTLRADINSTLAN